MTLTHNRIDVLLGENRHKLIQQVLKSIGYGVSPEEVNGVVCLVIRPRIYEGVTNA